MLTVVQPSLAVVSEEEDDLFTAEAGDTELHRQAALESNTEVDTTPSRMLFISQMLISRTCFVWITAHWVYEMLKGKHREMLPGTLVYKRMSRRLVRHCLLASAVKDISSSLNRCLLYGTA